MRKPIMGRFFMSRKIWVITNIMQFSKNEPKPLNIFTPYPYGWCPLQANVNLDALLEKMKAELERAKRFEPLKFDETVEECLSKVQEVMKERERERNSTQFKRKGSQIYFSLCLED
ncbi:MAG: hypothetical protein J7L37_08990 [Thermococcus sp.]|nr:hypothetical protein [Thermococcus sp.]